MQSQAQGQATSSHAGSNTEKPPDGVLPHPAVFIMNDQIPKTSAGRGVLRLLGLFGALGLFGTLRLIN